MNKLTKPPKIALIILAVITFIIFIGYMGGQDKREVESVVKTELNQLKNLDEESVSSCISYTDLFPESESQGTISNEIREIFPLFFDGFSYQIMNTEVNKGKATVDVRIHVIDAATLAKDYMKAAMQKRIASSANPSAVEYSLEDYYYLLRDLLMTNEYDTVEENCQLYLEKKDSQWVMTHSKVTDNQLTGDFVGHLSNANLFTPEEIVSIHFDTIKSFDLEQLKRYLKLDDMFDTDDTTNRALTQAVATQIHDHFNYQILESENDGETASVSLEIISYDLTDVLASYETQLNSYLATAQALEDGHEGRLAVANQLLIDCINASTAEGVTPITLELANDGSSWKLQMTDEVAQAILGNIGTSLSDVSNNVPNDAQLEAAAGAENTEE